MTWRGALGVCLGMLAGAAVAPCKALADAPMSYLWGAGTRAYPVVTHLWGLIAISSVVVLIVTGLLLAGLLRQRGYVPLDAQNRVPVVRAAGGMRWIYVGSGCSLIALVVMATWSFLVLAEVSRPERAAPFTVEVVGHQWWWEIRYRGDEAARDFTTANEIHIPTGMPVRVRLIGADVIHSFWVPALTGKTDIIPGQTNVTWMEASASGVFRGQCAEFCGLQHAHMAFMVVAQPPADFQRWWDRQLTAAPALASAEVGHGDVLFLARCGACHSVRGTAAGGIVGPDLTHVMDRRTLAAGTLPNVRGHLTGWIADPQQVKPGNAMPTLDLSGAELTSVRRYVEVVEVSRR